MPLSLNNASCLGVSLVPVTNCKGEVSPLVTISNNGAENLTSLDINYMVNEEMVNTYNWTGNLSYGEMADVQLPAVSFAVQDENNLKIYTANPNGNPDEDPLNDTTLASFMGAQQVVPDVYLFLKLDNHPAETTYELINSAGEGVYSGGPFSQPLAFVKDTFQLDMNDCYTFVIHDAGGDGLTDGGYYTLRQSNFNIIYENTLFSGFIEMVEFAADAVGVSEKFSGAEFTVFPNPVNEQAGLSFHLARAEQVDIKVFNLIGEVVISKLIDCPPGNQSLNLDLSNVQPGVYFIAVKTDEKTMTQKISIK
jgi:hypothetical protein